MVFLLFFVCLFFIIVSFFLIRYDYLEFTDAKGLKVRYDQKVGSNKWPKQVHFAGPHLHFIFRSDSSNTEWGYKFKVSLQFINCADERLK